MVIPVIIIGYMTFHTYNLKWRISVLRLSAVDCSLIFPPCVRALLRVWYLLMSSEPSQGIIIMTMKHNILSVVYNIQYNNVRVPGWLNAMMPLWNSHLTSPLFCRSLVSRHDKCWRNYFPDFMAESDEHWVACHTKHTFFPLPIPQPLSFRFILLWPDTQKSWNFLKSHTGDREDLQFRSGWGECVVVCVRRP